MAASVVGTEVVTGDVEITGDMISGVGLTAVGAGMAVPGFVDVHTHGYAGVDFATATPSDYGLVSSEITSTGVTAFRPTMMSLPVSAMRMAVERHALAASTGARILGIHLEGPFLSPLHAGAHSPDSLLPPSIEVVGGLVGAGRVGHVTIAPELSGALDLIAWLLERGITVSLGHSDADAATAHRAFDLGARALTHAFNASRSFHHRDPGLVGAALSRDDVYIEAVVDAVHLSDETVRVLIRAAGSRLVAVTDATAAAGCGDGSYAMGNRLVKVEHGVARLADGTIAGSALTMDTAFRSLVGLGLDVVSAANATSAAPAALTGHPELGTLTPGTPADIVVLDDDLSVVKTLVGGVVHHGF